MCVCVHAYVRACVRVCVQVSSVWDCKSAFSDVILGVPEVAV